MKTLYAHKRKKIYLLYNLQSTLIASPFLLPRNFTSLKIQIFLINIIATTCRHLESRVCSL